MKFLTYKSFILLGVLSGLVLIQACGRPVEKEASCNFVQNQNLQRVSWVRPELIDLRIDESVPAEFISGIEAAIHYWNTNGEQNFGGAFFRLKVDRAGYSSPTRDGYSKIYFLNDWEMNKSNEQARTTIYWSGKRIYEADIRVNNKNFDFFVGENPDQTKVHLESLLIHELGHVLGLGHTDDRESVMQRSLPNGELRDNLSRLDVESLKCEYKSI